MKRLLILNYPYMYEDRGRLDWLLIALIIADVVTLILVNRALLT